MTHSTEHLNIEIKAKCHDLDSARTYLKEKGARFVGVDHQIDTYFDGVKGRLKLREGSIERNWIHYHRSDDSAPKASDVALLSAGDLEYTEKMKHVLDRALGIKVVVDKKREIYFIDNVKFHLDVVKGLGQFLEIEAIGMDTEFSSDDLLEQCNFYMKGLGVAEVDLCKVSYSDLLLELEGKSK